jgi:hypothetical protein
MLGPEISRATSDRTRAGLQPASGVRWQAGCPIDCPDASGHLEPERDDDTIDDLERHSEQRRILDVPMNDAQGAPYGIANRTACGMAIARHLVPVHRPHDG